MKDIKPENLINNPFISLKHKGFRYYWITQGISVIGTWMMNISIPWLAFTITKSALLLSLVGVFQYMPILLFSLFAGVILDRFPKKKILIITQSISLIISFLFYILIAINRINYAEILILAMLLGFANTIDMPARQSFMIELVGKDDLMNAIGLNSTAFNIARIFGPAIAGVIIAASDIGVCFIINSISYLGLIIALFFIKPISRFSGNKNSKLNVLSQIKDALSLIIKNKILFQTLFMVFVIGTFAFNFNILVPVFAKDVLNQQASGYGFLMSSMGMGSLIGAIIISFISKSGPKKIILSLFPVIISLAFIITGFTSNYYVSAAFIGICGFLCVVFTTTANSTTQINTNPEFHGRIMSVYSLLMAGTTPIGNFYCGVLMKYIGPRSGFIGCGLAIGLLILGLYLFRSFNTSFRHN